jgi:hypothetical protein
MVILTKLKNTFLRSTTEPPFAREVKPLLLCTERTKRAFDNREMSFEERKQFVEASKAKVDLFIFPDALMPDAEREFPGQEPVEVIQKYVQNHPEVELKKWQPAL